MKRDDPVADRLIAHTLKAGAYTAFALIVAGLVLQLYSPLGRKVTVAGVLVLLSTPVLRIIVAAIQFFRERDIRYTLVSLGVLGIVLLAYFLGIQA